MERERNLSSMNAGMPYTSQSHARMLYKE